MKWHYWAMSGISASLLAASVFSWRSFDVTETPSVIKNATPPVITSQCTRYDHPKVLDRNGYLGVTVWNIYKQQKANWRKGLTKFTQDSQLVLLQEAKLSTNLSEYLHQSHWQVTMANAFKFNNTSAGVMNLSTVNSISTCAYLAMEPWLRLPKSALLSEYALSNGQTLAVVNLHGVNFAIGLKDYRAQFAALQKVLEKHQGPIILAGDFNTWREGRLQVVREFAAALRLKSVSFARDQRLRVFGYPLDHLYYRDLVALKADAPRTEDSDHNPILVQFSLKGVGSALKKAL